MIVVEMSEKKRVILGGTFDGLHIGHKSLLRRGLEEGHLTVGLVSDQMLEEWKPEVERDFSERKKELEKFLSLYDGWDIVKIDDPFQEAIEGSFEKLIVSYETEKRGKKINEMREERGKDPLDIIVVDPVLADDLLPVSSTRIREGDINKNGERLTPVRVKVGSKNPVKIETAKDVLSEYFDVDMTSENFESGESQPFNMEIVKNAADRAEIDEEFDYGVGIESGIVTTEKGNFSVEYAVLKDRMGFVSKGHGPGFSIPEGWLDELRSGMTLGTKMKAYFDDYTSEKGSVHILSGGTVEREDCIRSALHMAMIPRLNAELYHEDMENL